MASLGTHMAPHDQYTQRCLCRGGPPQDGPLAGPPPSLWKNKKCLRPLPATSGRRQRSQAKGQEATGFIRYFDRGRDRRQKYEETSGFIKYFMTPELLFRTPAGRPGPVPNTKKSFEHKKIGTGFYGKSIEIHDSDRPQELIN